MGCGCGKRSTTRQATPRPASPSPTTAPVDAAAQVFHEVYKNGRFTGRRFSSIMAAQRYADRIGGEVK